MLLWESSTLRNFVPNSDIGTSNSQITWTKTLKLSDFMRLWRHHRKRKEHIQGSIETKVSERHYLWTDTTKYRGISCENTTQLRRKLLCLLPNVAGKFIFSNNWRRASLKAQVSKSKHNKLIVTMLLIERHVSAYSEAIIRFNKL